MSGEILCKVAQPRAPSLEFAPYVMAGLVPAFAAPPQKVIPETGKPAQLAFAATSRLICYIPPHAGADGRDKPGQDVRLDSQNTAKGAGGWRIEARARDVPRAP